MESKTTGKKGTATFSNGGEGKGSTAGAVVDVGQELVINECRRHPQGRRAGSGGFKKKDQTAREFCNGKSSRKNKFVKKRGEKPTQPTKGKKLSVE